MQTHAHTQAALQAQLEAQAQVPAQDHGGPSTMERFKRMLPPSFKGESDPLLAESWMREIEKFFRAIRCADEDKVTLATYMLQAGGRDGAIPGRKESFVEEASSDIPTARQEESGVPDTAAIRGSRQFSGTLCTFPWCEERVSPLWEDTWWYRMLDDYGQVLEVRKQRPHDQGLPKTSTGSLAWSASPSGSSGSSSSYRKTRKASSPSSSVFFSS
ncbi:hypothetical protein Taro_044056 [Colocasia esculenta]|uniref:Uncharacterized protein n=1 Tax=Colocasia esculenta TaxID=4460 RepID=A0A843X020_COLES|nr:hypothetical protein [Colocasia esculenta]